MSERLKPNEAFINPESQNAVARSTLLLNHESAFDFIFNKVMDFPIKRVIVFGEPGANKTTIMLQLASELMQKSPDIEPDFIFYDDALAKVKDMLRVNTLSKSHYPIVSNILSKQMKERFPKDDEKDKRRIQFVELVGISLNDRGTSTLRTAAKRANGLAPLEQDTLVIGVTADSRSLKDAGEMRGAVADLDDPKRLFELLKGYNTFVTGIPEDKPIDETTNEIIGFFGRMASEDRIEVVHNEVMTQANRRLTEDDNRIFRMLRVPNLPFPIEDRDALKSYLQGAAFLQMYLTELGLRKDPYNMAPDYLRDMGVVVFSPYNPNIPKIMNLSRVLKK
jgi:hypothetical protein